MRCRSAEEGRRVAGGVSLPAFSPRGAARCSGARGKVALPYECEEGTAKAGKDYEHVSGKLIYNNEENK